MTSVVENTLPIFPPTTSCMLRYHDVITMNAGTGVLTSYVFTANGLYDPNITSTGHQPMGFDSIMGYYEHYHVTAATIRVVFQNTGTLSHFVGIRLDPDVSPLTDITQAIENGLLVYDTVSPTSMYGAFRELKMSVNIPKFNGIKNRAIFMADEGLRGNVASNPTEQTYFHVLIWANASSSITNLADVTITYHATFTEPRPRSLSLTLHRLRDLESGFEKLDVDTNPDGDALSQTSCRGARVPTTGRSPDVTRYSPPEYKMNAAPLRR